MQSVQQIAHAIVGLHDRQTRAWHQPDASTVQQGEAQSAEVSGEQAAFLEAVERQHRANFDLWHIEDEARRPEASDGEIASTKRRIDRTNQQRNDLAEKLDLLLLSQLEPLGLPCPTAPLNSESPGLIIDRLSILSLKTFHTREEIDRPNPPAGHGERNRSRLAILEEQRQDLARCLDDLWQQSLAGTRRFRLYKQLKMYNDPALNPAIYSSK